MILKTAARCGIPETERLQVQRLFPANKVFSQRFECEDELEELISYSNVDPKWGFLAVYAGTTEQQAKAFLAKVAATGRFPGANVRRMQVMFVVP